MFWITYSKLLKLLFVVCGFGWQTYDCKNYIQNICSVAQVMLCKHPRRSYHPWKTLECTKIHSNLNKNLANFRHFCLIFVQIFAFWECPDLQWCAKRLPWRFQGPWHSQKSKCCAKLCETTKNGHVFVDGIGITKNANLLRHARLHTSTIVKIVRNLRTSQHQTLIIWILSCLGLTKATSHKYYSFLSVQSPIATPIVLEKWTLPNICNSRCVPF